MKTKDVNLMCACVQIHSGGSLIKAPDVRQSVIDGKVAAGEVFGPSLAPVHPVFALDAIPFLATNYPSARRLWNLARPLAEKKAIGQGFAVLYSVPWPPQGMFSSKEIRTVGDLQAMNMRENSPSVKKLAESLGAKPVLVETPDLVSAVNSDKVSLVFTSAAQGVDTKMWEKLPWFYQTNA
jgi:TRAP-type C4-dicarboxylate transport system substrate-binding protein